MKKTIKNSIIFGLFISSAFIFSFITADIASAQTVYFIDSNGNLVDANDPSAQTYLNSLNGGNTNVSTGSNMAGLNGNAPINNAGDSAFVPAPYLQYQYFNRSIDYYNGNTGYMGNNAMYGSNNIYGANTGFNGFMNNPNAGMPTLNQSYQFQPAPTLRYVYHNAEQDAISRAKIFGNGSMTGQIYNPYSYQNQNTYGVNTLSRNTSQSQPMTFGGGSGFVMTSQQ